MKTKQRTILAKKLFGRKGRYWVFPSAPKPKVPMADSVRAALPLYATYPEFLLLTEPSLVACALPDKTEVLKTCRQIKVAKGDFLANDWLKRVSKTWRESLSPEFAFRPMSGNVRYWWCKVLSAKGASALWTYLLFAVDTGGRLLRYTFYSAGEKNDDSHYYLVRSSKTRFEKEETYKSSKQFIANVRKISRKGEHFICQEETRDEFIQAIKNRDGTFCVEYQMYYMPWQMMNEDCSMKDVLRILCLFLKGGIPAISNAIEWALCEHNNRKPFDLGTELVKKLTKAEKSGCQEIVDTIHAVGVTSETPRGQIVYPTFLNKRGRPVHWESTLYYLPKRVSRKVKALVRVCASLDKDIFPYHQRELGKIFSAGIGVRRNYKLALFWEKKALRRGSAAARHEVSKLKAMLDPDQKRKSTKRRERLQTIITEALRNFTTGKNNREIVCDQVYEILVEAECCIDDGRMTKKDGSAVLRMCDNVLRGIDDGSISASPPSPHNPKISLLMPDV